MGRLDKLRSRFFCKKGQSGFDRTAHEPSHELEPDSSRKEAEPVDISLPHSAIVTPPQPVAPSEVRPNVHGLYWSEARRIHSAPAVNSTSCALPSKSFDIREDRTSVLAATNTSSVSCCWEAESDGEVDDDEVFLENSPGINSSDLKKHSGRYSVTRRHSSYKDFAALQHSNGWTWPSTEVVDCSAWEDWRLSPREIVLGPLVSCTPAETIYRGYWHGRVHVRTREAIQVEDLVCFLKEVQTLSCIRHENFQLFMGACLDLQQQQPLSLVMSELKGESLHRHLHRYGHTFTSPSRLKILQQIAEGMAYLHAKQITHGLLSSSYITLTCRVCISMPPRQSHANLPHQSCKYHPWDLPYLPPEYIRELKVCHDRPRVVQDVRPRRGTRTCSEGVIETSRTFQRSQPATRNTFVSTASLWMKNCSDGFPADVFGFGTIVYEISTLEFPYKDLPIECSILRIGSGDVQSLEQVTNKHFKTIISSCWRPTPQQRLTFKDLVTCLERNATAQHPRCRLKSSSSLPLLLLRELC